MEATPAPAAWRRVSSRVMAGALLWFLSACGGGSGESPPAPAPAPAPAPVPEAPGSYTDPQRYAADPTASLPSAVEGAARSEHRIVLDGVPLSYTATAGHLTVRAPGGTQDQAALFYVAYTAHGATAAAQRPLTFFYNGGPGSASVWLHLGSFGPKRLDTRAPSTSTPRPFALVDNAESLLDVSDLVFVNAVGSGWSQAIAPFNNQRFWGVDADAALFRDFVMRYVTVNQRQASPKYLFGESYGGPRTAVLATLLEMAGMPLKGLVLQAPAMNYNSNCGVVGDDRVDCSGYLPTYAAVAAYHQRLSSPPPALDLQMNQLREFAGQRYAPAVARVLQGAVAPDELPPLLSEHTGLPSALWRSHFNMPPYRFSASLLLDTVIGRYDARMTAPRGTPLASEGDPSSTFISASFASAIAAYLRNTLGYRNDSPYVLLSRAIETWDFSHAGQDLPDTIPDLGAALTLNPQLKVLNMNGYHDLATPFYQSERDLARLALPGRITVRNYPGGHMTYLDDDARRLQKADLKAFYADRLTAQALPLPPSPRSASASARLALAPSQPPSAPEGSLQMPRREPWVPPALRQAARLAPASQGQALQVEVEARLRAHFMAASGGAPQLSRSQAQRAGLQAVAQSFDAMDAQGQGSIRFEDWLRHLRRTGAAQQ